MSLLVKNHRIRNDKHSKVKLPNLKNSSAKQIEKVRLAPILVKS